MSGFILLESCFVVTIHVLLLDWTLLDDRLLRGGSVEASVCKGGFTIVLKYWLVLCCLCM